MPPPCKPDAPFETAFALTMGNEGGYSNHPDDRGGETYRGITRVHHPKWTGWTILDGYDTKSDETLILDIGLQAAVKHFYVTTFWDPWRGDDVALRSLPVALEVFDTAVLHGKRSAVKYLQRALNVLNRKAVLFADLVVDGQVGPATLRALATIVGKHTGEDVLLTWMNIAQGAHLLEQLEKNEAQESFAWGWTKRLAK